MQYHVELLRTGSSVVPGPELFWMSEWDAWFPLAFQVALVRGGDVVAIVNTGPAQDLGPMNDQWASFLGERARMQREPGEFVTEHLEARGLSPRDVTHVVLTPLQLYSVSNVLLFDRAQICISRRGWLHFHSTHAHPHDDRDSTIPPHILARLVGDWWPRVRLLDDEDQIAEGLRTWWSGGHHRASLAVEVDTASGTAVLSDSFFYLENVEKDHPIGIAENIYECLAAHARARRAAHVVPLYDPKNFERFPGGVIG